MNPDVYYVIDEEIYKLRNMQEGYKFHNSTKNSILMHDLFFSKNQHLRGGIIHISRYTRSDALTSTRTFRVLSRTHHFAYHSNHSKQRSVNHEPCSLICVRGTHRGATQSKATIQFSSSWIQCATPFQCFLSINSTRFLSANLHHRFNSARGTSFPK